MFLIGPHRRGGMNYKRSKLEIYLEVMKAINRGTEKPTRVMYKTNLSWQPLMKVLESLQDQGFITGHKKGNCTVYKVTKKKKTCSNTSVKPWPSSKSNDSLFPKSKFR